MYLPLVVAIAAFILLNYIGYRIERKAQRALDPVELGRLNVQDKNARWLGVAFCISLPLASTYLPPHSSWPFIFPLSLLYAAGSYRLIKNACLPRKYVWAREQGILILSVSVLLLSVAMFYEQRNYEAKRLVEKMAACSAEPVSPKPSIVRPPNGAR